MLYDFVINPFIKVGPINFGSTREEVIHIIGYPQKEVKTHFDNIRLEYLGFAVVIENNAVVEMNFIPQVKLQLEGRDIFNDVNIFKFLQGFDANPRKIHDSLVFSKIGISLSGFDNPKETPVVTVFRKGYWDDVS